jgi:hypothetical protein
MASKMPASDAEDLIDGDLAGAEQRQRDLRTFPTRLDPNEPLSQPAILYGWFASAPRNRPKNGLRAMPFSALMLLCFRTPENVYQKRQFMVKVFR